VGDLVESQELQVIEGELVGRIHIGNGCVLGRPILRVNGVYKPLQRKIVGVFPIEGRRRCPIKSDIDGPEVQSLTDNKAREHVMPAVLRLRGFDKR